MQHRNDITPRFSDFKTLAADHNTIPVYRKIPVGDDTPVTAYLKLQSGGYGFLLETVDQLSSRSRLSVIGTEPTSVIKTGKGTALGEVDPLTALADQLNAVRYPETYGMPAFRGGAVGYIAYDAIRFFEPRVPSISDEPHPLNVPEAIFMITDSMAIFERWFDRVTIVANAKLDDDTSPEDAYQAAIDRVDELVERMSQPLFTPYIPDSAVSPANQGRNLADAIDYSHIGSAAHLPTGMNPELENQPYHANMTKGDYIDMVKECKQAIYDGEIIQVVVSQRLERRTHASPFNLYCALRSINPSPYMFYLNLDGFQIIGASPELMVQVLNGKVAVHPIAGSRPRGDDPEHDEELASELRRDEKEIAEHTMLLDLGRNDVGRIATPGTVKVTQKLDIERYSHIMHLVSHVEGELDPQHTIYDALRAGFPAGTVSGAPKIRAMEIIADQEPDKRGPYSGAVGYWAYNGNMDTAISLRTMMLKDNIAYLQAGGGIVADSDPETEYHETLHKMGALHHAIEAAEKFT